MNNIKCKYCGREFEISEAFVHKYKEEIEKASEEKHKLDLEKVKTEAEEKALEKAKKEFEEKSKEEIEKIKDQNEEFKKQQLKFKEERLEFEESRRKLEIENAKKLLEEKEKVAKELEEGQRMKEREKDLKIENLQRMLEEANRKASGVSQQVQGEVLELDLEENLAQAFPTDLIEPVAKGTRGGDIVQVVKNSMGKVAGTILWETKRAKWSPSWLQKLREDARKVGASASILVSEDLPKDTQSFGFVDQVLVTSYQYALSLAVIVRRGIMQTAAAKSAAENKDETLEMVYQYLQSDAFRHRIEGYVESISSMRIDLDSEKRSMERIWKKREMQIIKAESSISKLSGELEGIMGSSFPTIKNLTLESGIEDDEKPY